MSGLWWIEDGVYKPAMFGRESPRKAQGNLDFALVSSNVASWKIPYRSMGVSYVLLGMFQQAMFDYQKLMNISYAVI